MRWRRSEILRRNSVTVSTTLSSFNHLSTNVIHQVVDKFIVELQVQLESEKVFSGSGQEARNWLAEKGYDRAIGARPMARVIRTT